MGFRNDLATRRDTQIKTVVGLVVSVLYFAFAISQFVAVDQAQRQPAYIPLVGSTRAQAQSFPRFAVCPTWNADQQEFIEFMTCSLNRAGMAPLRIETTLAQHVIYTPRHGNTSWDSCRDVDPSTVGADSSSSYDFIDCSVQTGHHVMVYFFGDKTASEAPTANTAWTMVYHDSEANIGLSQTRFLSSSGQTTRTEWTATVQLENDVVLSNLTTIFTVQFASTSIQSVQEYYAYTFWECMGVIGGAGVIFAALYWIMTFALMQLLDVKAPTATSGPAYETIEDEAK